LFQKHSFNQTSFDQKFRKLDLTQERNSQNGGEKHNSNCEKTIEKKNQKRYDFGQNQKRYDFGPSNFGFELFFK